MALVARDCGGQGGVEHKAQVQFFFQSRAGHALAQQLHESGQHKGLRLQLHMAFAGAGKVENAVDHVQQHAAGFVDLRQVVALHAAELCLQAQVAHADDGVEGRADFVADAAQEIILHARGPLGQLQGGERLSSGLHGLLAVVAGRELCGFERVDAGLQGGLHVL